jgi:hypothetical protein
MQKQLLGIVHRNAIDGWGVETLDPLLVFRF